jgi:two-component system, cell cycle sensor histidine kinase and response regulator CckA
VRDDQEVVVSHEVILEDVTEQRQMEEQFRQAQKMEAIGQLAGGVAHDFNNLLTVILGYSELAAQVATEGSVRSDLQQIDAAAQRAQSLTQQLLAFSRRQMLDPRPLDLNQLVRDTEKMLRPLIGEDIELVLSLEPGILSVCADRGQIQEVITNLAVNARDAMPRGGKLVLQTEHQELTEPTTHEGITMPSGRYATLLVADTGVGMDAETRSRAFEPFFTTKESGKGTGLGLSTVFGVIRQSGGYLWVYSEPGQGTTFRIYLPWLGALAVAPAEPRSATSVLDGSETVLLVEDDDALRALARRILSAHGYAVIEAKTAAEAIATASARQGEIQLLVSDVVLPGISGLDLASTLTSQRPSMAVLYMSGYATGILGRYGSIPPAAFFLRKPFTNDGLLRKVREALDQGQQLKRAPADGPH